MSFLNLLFLDKKLTSSLGPYVDAEVERLTKNIVNKAVQQKMLEKDYGNFLIKESESFSYDIKKINMLRKELTDYIQEILMHLEKADIDDNQLFGQLKTSHFKKIKNGILAENSISSLRGTTIFGNIGPTVPIRLYFVGQVSTDIDIQIKEYGINNVIVEIYLIITVKEQVMMPISSKAKEIKIREIIDTNIIRGTIPNYYGGLLK